MNVSHVSKQAAVMFAAALLFAGLAASFSSHAADVEAGRKKAEACGACHGADGNAVLPSVPSLAGQPAQFIATQLLMFREGRRKEAQMSPFAAGLTNADLNNIAAYFSAQTLKPPSRRVSPAAAEAGPVLAKKFNCTQCHGPALLGQQHIPRLAGQQFEYLKAQLRGFKANTRFDMDGQMTSAAMGLGDADIDALADYLSAMK